MYKRMQTHSMSLFSERDSKNNLLIPVSDHQLVDVVAATAADHINADDLDIIAACIDRERL